MIPSKFDYIRVNSIDEAIQQLQQCNGEGKLIAGGHSLVPLLKFRLSEPGALIDISRIAELKGVQKDGDRIVIGALTTHFQVANDPIVKEHIPVLSETVRQIGDLQVRNRGTIGGNIAHADPAADLPAAAYVLDAEIAFHGEEGPETMNIDSFIVGPLITMLPENSVLTSVSFAIPPKHTKSTYLKFFHPASGYPVIGVAVVAGVGENDVIDYIKIAITGVGDVPYRATSVEDKLLGQTLSESVIKEAAQLAADEGEMASDLYTSEEYRRNLCKVYTERALKSVFY
ncbi:xanthine dehydrogenase family protein subunit M [Bacillus sp. DTU_2020_1000418_1_SI_GHA_SEK_038]|uniref:FAD binding domain-containing protein n=1 Tax=Bacillus sp. DTU_2020_1000418_1_SI_GHA_SEK_038 TaxID=3077585 RepID=UPI0028F13A36|nr:xanthine dehydrogenase family protein subunit M [Bacillus sp. DTU_2020_1000418_1_SI_GHA_SEK_038]WNS74949.1 xanthine dehydrogenase family protein subunit M [Bacillus sp. DTU_2020_1000418_1_SI_GHA_SEK_038]